MANTNKFEELLEYIVNGEQAKAESLFHNLVVEKSREIYEGLFDEEMEDTEVSEDSKEEDDEEDMEESWEGDEEGEGGMDVVGGDATDDMIGDVEADDDGADNGMGSDDMGGEDDVDARVSDLEAELEALKAEFEKLMGGEDGDDDGMMDMEPVGDEEDDEEGDEEDDEEDNESFVPFEEEIEEISLSPAEQMREYVEKIGDAYKGGKVASSSEASGANTKSVVASKNDMGGTTANIVKGGEGGGRNDAPGVYANKTQPQDGGNVNVPGSKTATKLKPQSRNWDKAHDSNPTGTNAKSILGK